MKRVPRRLERFFLDDDAAVRQRTLPGEDFDELRLAVTGYAGNPKNLAGMHLQIDLFQCGQTVIVVRIQRHELESDRTGLPLRPHRTLANLRVADHHPRHVLGRQIGDLAATDHFAASQYRHLVREGPHLAELVRDHDDSDVLALRHALEEAEHLVGLAGSQHRSRLVQNQEALVEIKELEDFELLFLARRKRRHLNIERYAKRHAVEELIQRAAFLLPVDHARRVGAAHHEVFRPRQ